MQPRDSVGQLDRNIQEQRKGERSRPKGSCKIAAAEVFHHEAGPGPRLDQPAHPDDTGQLQIAEHPGFVSQGSACARARRGVHLDQQGRIASSVTVQCVPRSCMDEFEFRQVIVAAWRRVQALTLLNIIHRDPL
ncbi:hypothetical protein AM586_27950 [Massilia sp. WG5]|nr:hypothetical protein AM586_27950 [Massilia sp. WG5]